jgi:DNA-binding response OmpR family regulator
VRTISRDDLMARVWDVNWFGSTKTLDVTIASLRHRLSSRAAVPTITTLRGHGYRLDPPGQELS